jgi:hypothetical protein
LQLQRTIAASVSFFQTDLDFEVLIGASLSEASLNLGAPKPPKQRLEKIAEIGAYPTPAAAELSRLLPTWRRAEFLTRFPISAEPIIGFTPRAVTQYLVGFGHFFEAFLGIGFLTDVGMIFTGQFSIGFFYFIIRSGTG